MTVIDLVLDVPIEGQNGIGGKNKMEDKATDIKMSSKESSPTSVPDVASETSRGSSVSSDLQREYEDILRYAIVTPRFEAALPNVYGKFEGETASKPNVNLSTIAEVSSNETSLSLDAASENDGKDYVKEFENSKHTPAKTITPTFRGESVGRSIAFQNNINDGGSPSSLLSSSVISFPGQFDDKIDDDLMRMESLMEEWCLQLKRNVLAEFSNSKLKQLEMMKQNLEMHKKRHAAEEDTLKNQIENQNELLHAFEKSIHQKDVVITNLTNTLQKQREKQEKLKILLSWKLKHNDEKREQFASKLAEKHYKRSIMSKTWLGWRSVIEMRWKQRVERACQARSQEVCIKLTQDYEERLQALQKSLEMARTEIANLHSERDNYEEAMKKAFMRGVCALNMEAMNMFKANDEAVEPKEPLNRDKQAAEKVIAKESIASEIRAKNNSDLKNYKNGSEKTIHVKAVGKSSFVARNSRNERSGKDSFQPTITSVYVEKHNGNQKSSQPNYERSRHIAFDDVKKGRKLKGTGLTQSVKVVE